MMPNNPYPTPTKNDLAQDANSAQGDKPWFRIIYPLSTVAFFEEWRTIIIYTFVLFVGFFLNLVLS